MLIMRKQTALLFLFLIGFTLHSRAQIWPGIKTDTKDFLNTGSDFYGSIFSARKLTYKNAALLGLGVFGVSLLDKTMRTFAQEHQNTVGNSLFSIDDYYGDKWYTAGGIVVLYSAGLLSGNKNLRETGLLTAEAWFYTGLLTVIVKELFGRSRPYTNSGTYDFYPFRFTESKRSFFSGHSSTVMAVSTVMSSRSANFLWKTAWYSAALLTSTARIYHDQHWLSDVAAGALIGYFAGRFIVRKAQNRGGNKIQLSSRYSAAGRQMFGITILLN